MHTFWNYGKNSISDNQFNIKISRYNLIIMMSLINTLFIKSNFTIKTIIDNLYI